MANIPPRVVESNPTTIMSMEIPINTSLAHGLSTGRPSGPIVISGSFIAAIIIPIAFFLLFISCMVNCLLHRRKEQNPFLREETAISRESDEKSWDEKSWDDKPLAEIQARRSAAMRIKRRKVRRALSVPTLATVYEMDIESSAAFSDGDADDISSRDRQDSVEDSKPQKVSEEVETTIDQNDHDAVCIGSNALQNQSKEKELENPQSNEDLDELESSTEEDEDIPQHVHEQSTDTKNRPVFPPRRSSLIAHYVPQQVCHIHDK